MPQPDRLLATLERAVRAFRATPGRAGRLVRLPAGAEVCVVGDLHGNIENFRRLLQRADLAAQPQRHLVFQEVIHGASRYPGGGDRSHQLVDLLAALKCQYPERVHFLLGNHELAQWHRLSVIKDDIDQTQAFLAGVLHAYGAWSEAILAAYDALFDAAGLAVRTANRVFVSHSLPAAKYLPDFRPEALESEAPNPTEWQAGGSLYALVWGRDVRLGTVETFLAKVDADWLLTGHIPCDEGYRAPNARQIILDALGTPACACLFRTDRPVTQADLRAGIITL